MYRRPSPFSHAVPMLARKGNAPNLDALVHLPNWCVMADMGVTEAMVNNFPFLSAYKDILGYARMEYCCLNLVGEEGMPHMLVRYTEEVGHEYHLIGQTAAFLVKNHLRPMVLDLEVSSCSRLECWTR